MTHVQRMLIVVSAACLLPTIDASAACRINDPGNGFFNPYGSRLDSAFRDVMSNPQVINPALRWKLTVDEISAVHAIGKQQVDRQSTLTADERLFVLRFRIQNGGQEAQPISRERLAITVTDQYGLSYNDVLMLRIDGDNSPFSRTLQPGESARFAADIRVPADNAIVCALIFDALFEGMDDFKGLTHFITTNQYLGEKGFEGMAFMFFGGDPNYEEMLPRTLSDDGLTANRVLSAGTGRWLALGVTDVRVNGHRSNNETTLGLAPRKGESIIRVDVSLRNRGMQELGIDRGTFRQSAIALEDGDRRPLARLVNPESGDTSIRMGPGETATATLLFKAPEGIRVDRADIVERIGYRGGALSRLYRVDLGGGGNADGKTVAGIVPTLQGD